MKIVSIMGSPRPKSKSKDIAREVINGIKTSDTTVSEYDLGKMKYRGCVGCYYCKTGGEKCAIKDELTSALDEIHEADVLLVSTPVYFYDVTSQLKGFIDRCYGYAKPDFMTNPNPSRLPDGKKLVFIQTQGVEEEKHKDIYEKASYYFDKLGFKEQSFIHAHGNMDPSSPINDNDRRQIEDTVSSLTQ